MKRYCIEFEIFEEQGGQLVKEGDDGQVFLEPLPVPRIVLRAPRIRHVPAAAHRQARAAGAAALDGKGPGRTGRVDVDRRWL